jgi:NAD(P)-dependent dehydrogenase (short-subunit alcohol dehydrogenase family)
MATVSKSEPRLSGDRAVLVTGTSTGIGLATTRELLDGGFRVYATVRNDNDGLRLQALGARAVRMDVTDSESITRARDQVSEDLRGTPLVGVINNAGVAAAGPLELLAADEFRATFEVNVFGVLEVSRAFLPLLKQSRGRIINIGSLSGHLALPFIGPYVASKFALEGLSDSLRRELMFVGVDVILIEPGSVRTPIWEKFPADGSQRFPPSEYDAPLHCFETMARKTAEDALDPVTVARAVRRALTRKHPPERIVVADIRSASTALLRLLPDRLLDRLIARQLRGKDAA